MRFLLVDRILSLDPGRSIHAVKLLPGTEELFQDHFPGFPVVPGVLLVEMMGQAAAKCLASGNVERGVPFLVKIISASFRDWVSPDQTVDLLAEVVTNRPQFATVRTQASVDGVLRASADLMFGFAPRERFASGYRDAVLEDFLNQAAPRS